MILFLLLAQERPVLTAENPLSQLKDEVKRVLTEAALPFTDEQERGIVIMMEERRRSSEDLFGEIMDFRAGPTQGQQMDRARDAIQWMRTEFLARLRDYLSPEQLAVWNRFESSGGLAPLSATEAPRTAASRQTQYVRINNNAFTAEESGYRFGLGSNRGGTLQATEVIQRGGAGAFHGNLQILVKDESLNARNPFAHNKPPYQERQGVFDIGGPVIPDRLSATFYADQSEAENVDTIHATLPDGIFDFGITRPTLVRRAGTTGTYQLNTRHSLTFNVRYGITTRKNQNTGGFNMPERASDSRGDNWNFELKQFSSLSSEALYETKFEVSANHEESVPFSNEVQINVLDAFRSGGSQNAADYTWRNYIFGNLYTKLGEKQTLKTGIDGVYRASRSFSRNNFFGSFTFSSLDAFLRGEPLNYRVNRGNPLLDTKQLELAFFFQDDVKLSPRLTFMYGGRYDFQTNLGDRNNFAPRLGVAYSPGGATVIRGGAGIFYQRLGLNIVEAQQRLDGVRQYEIVVDRPSYPNPFQSGTINPLSRRVTDQDLAAPYNIVAMVSAERTFFKNLVFSAAYDINRETRRLRYRNLNGPLDIAAAGPRSCRSEQSAGTCVRPQPEFGNILNLESTGLETAHNFRLNFRQRFSIFNLTGSYSTTVVYGDSIPNAGLGTALGPGNQGAVADSQLPTDNYNLRVDWGRAPFPTHQAAGSVNARLPLGIFLTGSVSANSGRYYNITTGKDDNRDTVVNDRPAGVIWYSANGPNFLSFSFNISKAFFFSPANGGAAGGTRTNMNLFANMTNAFNRLNPGSPSGVMTSPNFGRSTSAVDPRQIEVGLRFQF